MISDWFSVLLKEGSRAVALLTTERRARPYLWPQTHLSGKETRKIGEFISSHVATVQFDYESVMRITDLDNRAMKWHFCNLASSNIHLETFCVVIKMACAWSEAVLYPQKHQRDIILNLTKHIVFFVIIRFIWWVQSRDQRQFFFLQLSFAEWFKPFWSNAGLDHQRALSHSLLGSWR